MRILVAFGSTEGQTKKIADHIVNRICELGQGAESYDCAGPLSGKKLGSFDAIVVAASVHQRLHQDHVAAFVVAHRAVLKDKPSAFISVSLSAAFEDGKVDARDYVDRFMRDTGWQPTHRHMAAGALRFTEYDFFKEQIIRHIVMKERDVPDAGQDYEFTDWDSLDSFVTAAVEDWQRRA